VGGRITPAILPHQAIFIIPDEDKRAVAMSDPSRNMEGKRIIAIRSVIIVGSRVIEIIPLVNPSLSEGSRPSHKPFSIKKLNQ